MFFDPPYGLVAAGKYEGGITDLSEIPVDKFVETWTKILSYWDHCRVAFLMASLRADGNYYDLPMMIGESLAHSGWTVLERIVKL